MRIGIIGRGPWGDVYARTLSSMGVDYWQDGHGWRAQPPADGIIIASAPASHYWLARELLRERVPIIIEKPICLNAGHARHLMDLADKLGSIVYCGHTRLYSVAWHQFKRRLKEVTSVYAVAGGQCKIEPRIDWGSHLVAMCLDIGFDPARATIITAQDEMPLLFEVNGLTFRDEAESPSPLENLLNAFIDAIEDGVPDFASLRLGAKVVEFLNEPERAAA